MNRYYALCCFICSVSFLTGMLPALAIALYWKVNLAFALIVLAPLIGFQSLQIMAIVVIALYIVCTECYKKHVGASPYIEMFY